MPRKRGKRGVMTIFDGVVFIGLLLILDPEAKAWCHRWDAPCIGRVRIAPSVMS